MSDSSLQQAHKQGWLAWKPMHKIRNYARATRFVLSGGVRWMLAVSHAVGGRNGHHKATRTSLNTLATCVPVVAHKPSGAAWPCGDGIR